MARDDNPLTCFLIIGHVSDPNTGETRAETYPIGVVDTQEEAEHYVKHHNEMWNRVFWRKVSKLGFSKSTMRSMNRRLAEKKRGRKS